MTPELAPPVVANMSAPPRSTVMLPRLAAGAARAQSSARQEAVAAPPREVPVGPGGGRLLSASLCVARVELPTAVAASLGVGLGARILTRPLGLARALVALARHADLIGQEDSAGRQARLELDRLRALAEADLIAELTGRIASIAWPHWAPRVGFAMPFALDPAALANPRRAPPAPNGISNPLLAARVVSAIRGPVFVRDAAPALANLLNLHDGATPSKTWEIWLPVRPGTVRPAHADSSSERGATS